jgi:GxxExxY protein
MLRIHHEGAKARRFDDYVEKLAEQVVDAAVQIHSTRGPGLLEGVHEACFAHELKQRRIPFQTQVHLPVNYHGLNLDAGLRLDVLVAETIIVEIKAVETLLPVHKAQVLTYLKLSGHSLGFLINFNVATLKEGIRRIVL